MTPRTRAVAVASLPAATLLLLLAAAPALAQPVRPTYRVEPLAGGAKALQQRFTAPQLALLEKLNRRDLEHLARTPTLVIPDPWDLDELAYAPFPRDYPAAAGLAKLLVIDQPTQAFAAYDHGRLVRWGPVSTGRKSRPTPDGVFHLNWRSPGRHSTVDPDWYMRWYFNFQNRVGLSLHEYELPGYPASHACVRLLPRDARWVYDWGEEWHLDPVRHTVTHRGTPLLILGQYGFGQPAPWTTPDGAGRTVALPAALPALD